MRFQNNLSLIFGAASLQAAPINSWPRCGTKKVATGINLAPHTIMCHTSNTVFCDPVTVIYWHSGVTWARIVALFTLTGALVVECVNQGHQAQANLVVDSLHKFVRRRLAGWIIDQGGWVSFDINTLAHQLTPERRRFIATSSTPIRSTRVCPKLSFPLPWTKPNS